MNKWTVKRKKLIDSDNNVIAEFTKESEIIIENERYKTLMTEDGSYTIITLTKGSDRQC